MRIRRDDIKAIGTATTVIEADTGQWFCELPKSYELWGIVDGLERCIKRWDKRRVFWIFQF
jgi:hypothetical protein